MKPMVVLSAADAPAGNIARAARPRTKKEFRMCFIFGLANLSLSVSEDVSKEDGNARVALHGIASWFAGGVEFIQVIQVVIHKILVTSTRMKAPMAISFGHEVHGQGGLEAQFKKSDCGG